VVPAVTIPGWLKLDLGMISRAFAPLLMQLLASSDLVSAEMS
jgi:hypothetical protein